MLLGNDQRLVAIVGRLIQGVADAVVGGALASATSGAVELERGKTPWSRSFPIARAFDARRFVRQLG